MGKQIQYDPVTDLEEAEDTYKREVCEGPTPDFMNDVLEWEDNAHVIEQETAD